MSKVTALSTKLAARDRVNKGEARVNVALYYGVSVRTVGRWIADVEASQATAAATLPTSKPKSDDKIFPVAKPTKAKKTKKKKPAKVKVAAPALTKNTGVAGGYADGDAYRQPVVVEDVDYRVLATRKSISLTRLVDGAVDGSAVIDRSAANFDDVFAIIVNGAMSQESLEKAFFMCQPKAMVEAFTKGKFQVNVTENNIVYTPDSGVPFEVSGLLSQRIIETIGKDGVEGAESLINFLDKLMLNPSNRSVKELYGFVEHNDIVITPTGTFYAWKVVREDYMDKHSNTMDNSVGLDVRVARNQVDENSEQTCSYGLHACAKSYISSFGGGSDRVVRVEIDPADVVAVPKDYKNAKLRCAGYKVIADVTDNFKADLA